MSLADELNQAIYQRPTITVWMDEWIKSLNAQDKKTCQAWLSDPNKPAAVIYRVLRRHGFSYGAASFRSWLRLYRESLG